MRPGMEEVETTPFQKLHIIYVSFEDNGIYMYI